jgi:hypothetical protein
MAMIEQSPSLAAKLDHSRNKKTLKYINGVPACAFEFKWWRAQV